MNTYGFGVTLPVSQDEAIALVRDALQVEGFGVLTEIDVRATLRKKLDVEFPPYVILGACNPTLAHRALDTNRDLGLLLPCNVIVHGVDGRTRILALDPVAQLSVAGDPRVLPVAEEARRRLQRAVAMLEQPARVRS